MPQPESNPTTVEGIELGQRLFHDPILSRDSSLSCASCHNPAYAFADKGIRISAGVHGAIGGFNTPALINSGWAGELFWDGRANGLEEQALAPVVSPAEMDLPWTEATRRLMTDWSYRDAFKQAFGDSRIDSIAVVMALAQFQRSLVSADSRYDRWRRGEIDFTDGEYRGYDLFTTEKADCFHCHVEPLFTDNSFHNTGLDSIIVGKGLGRVNGNPRDFGKWRTPSLRNLGFTHPYMHDGRFSSLAEVIDFYNSGGHFSVTLDPLIRNGGGGHPPPGRMANGLGLTDQDKADLLAFLRTLDDSVGSIKFRVAKSLSASM